MTFNRNIHFVKLPEDEKERGFEYKLSSYHETTLMTEEESFDLAEQICSEAFGENFVGQCLTIKGNENDACSFWSRKENLQVRADGEGCSASAHTVCTKQIEEIIVFLIKELNRQRRIENAKERNNQARTCEKHSTEDQGQVNDND